MASKHGRNKKICERYRNSGHKALNKAERQKRHEQRVDHFEHRKEEGKSYTYSKPHSQEKLKEAYSEKFLNSKFYNENKELMNSKVFVSNRNSNCARHTPVARWASVMRKLQNEIDTRQAALKAKERINKRANYARA